MQPTPESSQRRRRQPLSQEQQDKQDKQQPDNKLTPGSHMKPLPDGGSMIITDNFIR
jgi:hypothetical protein